MKNSYKETVHKYLSIVNDTQEVASVCNIFQNVSKRNDLMSALKDMYLKRYVTIAKF